MANSSPLLRLEERIHQSGVIWPPAPLPHKMSFCTWFHKSLWDMYPIPQKSMGVLLVVLNMFSHHTIWTKERKWETGWGMSPFKLKNVQKRCTGILPGLEVGESLGEDYDTKEFCFVKVWHRMEREGAMGCKGKCCSWTKFHRHTQVAIGDTHGYCMPHNHNFLSQWLSISNNFWQVTARGTYKSLDYDFLSRNIWQHYGWFQLFNTVKVFH